MNLLSRLNPAWVLRLALAAMYAFSAYDIYNHPTGWYWAVRPLPQSLQVIINNQVGIDRYLRFQAVGEFTLALLFLAWFLPRRVVRWVALLAALEMVLILWLVGVDSITFRDIGVLGAALALAVIYSK